jgi:hypothetical protein
MDRLRAVAGQRGEVMHFARGAGFDHQAAGGTQADADQMLVHRRAGEQRRDRRVVAVDAAVGQDDDVVAFVHRRLGALQTW